MPLNVPNLRKVSEFRGPDRMEQWGNALIEQLQSFFGQMKTDAEGRDRASEQPYQVTGHTANRVLDVSASTLAEVRQVLGTLIYDQGKRRQLRTSVT